MPKRVNNIYYDAIKFEKFIEAFKRTTASKKRNPSRIKYEMLLEDNIYKMGVELKNKTYDVGKYRSFVVKIPKERIIYCLEFEDRVVQQWYVREFIIPYMVPKFIKDSYACIKGRGVHGAVDTLQKYMRIAKREWQNPYILKYDIKKFFYSIDQEILFNIMKKYYKDKDFLELTEKFIKFNSQGQKSNEFGVGIPIGNYTSQYFANIYMNELDQYIKRVIKVKYYVRYMDDGVLILPNKVEARRLYELINKFVTEKLNLELNKKSQYFPLKSGVFFCGYRVYVTHKLVRKSNLQRMKKRIKLWNHIYENKQNVELIKKWKLSFDSWNGYSKFANTYKLRKSLIKKCDWIDIY